MQSGSSFNRYVHYAQAHVGREIVSLNSTLFKNPYRHEPGGSC